jgi:hypothetical protein
MDVINQKRNSEIEQESYASHEGAEKATTKPIGPGRRRLLEILALL